MRFYDYLNENIKLYTSDTLARNQKYDLSDLNKRIKYFTTYSLDRRNFDKKVTPIFACYLSWGKIIGMAEIQQSPYEPEKIWIKHISVDEKHRNKGIGKELLEYCFKYAKKHNYIIQPSTFEPDGKKYLKHNFDKLSKEYGVEVDYRDQTFDEPEVQPLHHPFFDRLAKKAKVS